MDVFVGNIDDPLGVLQKESHLVDRPSVMVAVLADFFDRVPDTQTCETSDKPTIISCLGRIRDLSCDFAYPSFPCRGRRDGPTDEGLSLFSCLLEPVSDSRRFERLRGSMDDVATDEDLSFFLYSLEPGSGSGRFGHVGDIVAIGYDPPSLVRYGKDLVPDSQDRAVCSWIAGLGRLIEDGFSLESPDGRIRSVPSGSDTSRGLESDCAEGHHASMSTTRRAALEMADIVEVHAANMVPVR
ncbi:hypothetical protein CMUS01_08828 [Colletotrichum musicola]|uniref:Uncharacterized protein n=1 Tax=Colletotrichum musicola TaxID=2175873 RepID=A0A8H6NCR7_9PEZI|nr:hypothetical protein CMUS01_08828 [Colletotrichum musicola]